MGLRLVLFTVAFNALLLVGRFGFVSAVAPHAPDMYAWLIALVAPTCLVALFLRMHWARFPPILVVSAISLAFITTVSGLQLA